jgi:hypothetical protein
MSSGLPLKADIARYSWHIANVPQAVSSATLIPALKALLNRIEISLDHCIENRRTTKSGEWNWVSQFQSPGVLAAIVQHYPA